MGTYEFVAQWVAGRLASRPGRVLDYGCGAGQIVRLMRARGIDAWGCDVFYEGGDYSNDIPSDVRPYIRRMEGAAIPFAAAEFDVVTSNQVFEHVPDMDVALREIARVMKPGATVLCLFPDRGVWREGHCGIPFLHWFPKRSTARIYYAALLRALGMGYHKGSKTVLQWSSDFCTWLDEWTYYRPRGEIIERFSTLIGKTTSAEHEWLQARLGRRPAAPLWLQRLAVRKLGGMTLVSTKQR